MDFDGFFPLSVNGSIKQKDTGFMVSEAEYDANRALTLTKVFIEIPSSPKVWIYKFGETTNTNTNIKNNDELYSSQVYIPPDTPFNNHHKVIEEVKEAEIVEIHENKKKN